MQPYLDKIKTELRLRGFSDNTITSYLLHNRKFLEQSQKNPEQVTEDDIKLFLSSLIEKGLTPSSISLVKSSLKFFYDEILKRDIFRNIKTPKKEHKLPRPNCISCLMRPKTGRASSSSPSCTPQAFA